ncbi:MAG: nucleoside-triphosphatase [Anaerolineales bacterium]|jgi:nucleoside-triphosphatase THEP1|nr:nucleoside-triphosphatase [Anaerolineales bacterium]
MTLYIITAPSGAGKTTCCCSLADQARAAGWDVAGILSPPVFENGEKVGIGAQDLRTNETRHLAIAASTFNLEPSTFNIPLGQWLFSSSALAWGNQILQTALPCDLLIIDELGPLEFFQGEGWQTALEILPCGEYKAAVVIVRPELLQNAIVLLGQAEVITLPLDPQSFENWHLKILNLTS